MILDQLDLDRHCGVIIAPSGAPCMRSLTCKSHAAASKRAVIGRSKEFDLLLSEYLANNPSKASSGASKSTERLASIPMKTAPGTDLISFDCPPSIKTPYADRSSLMSTSRNTWVSRGVKTWISEPLRLYSSSRKGQSDGCGPINWCSLVVACLIPFVKSMVTTCLSGGQIAMNFDGGPSPSTPLLLEQLKTQNVTAMFNIDSEKLAYGGVASIMKGIMQGGHLLGLMLNQSLDLNSMSNEGMRGTVEKRAEEFFKITGKWPLFLRVPSELASEKKQYLEAGGYLIVDPGLDISKLWAGSCEARFNATVGKSILAPYGSLIVATADTDSGCSVTETMKMISAAKSNGFALVRLDKCINLENTYRRNPADLSDVNYSLFEPSKPSTASIAEPTDSAGIKKAAINSSNSEKSKLFSCFGQVILLCSVFWVLFVSF